jgi:type IV secretory pathway VirB4 component
MAVNAARLSWHPYRQLQELRQFPEESLEEYAELAQDLAADGFPDTSDEFIQIVASDAFLKGCQDKRAALTAMDKDPENLDKAVQLVKSAMTNQNDVLRLANLCIQTSPPFSCM